MKQTAVEYLFEQLWETPKDKFTWNTILSKAKEMEKEQIVDAFGKERHYTNNDGYHKIRNSEQYYNETYGK
jgi:bisphosphoglycerate-dependent phosphoglycerate mutase